MIQDRKQSEGRHHAHLFEWVADKLRPVFDSPAVGTYDAGTTVDLKDCPICGRPMSEHTIDHSTQNTILNCPVPHPGAWDRDAFERVNEFGMVTREKSGPADS